MSSRTRRKKKKKIYLNGDELPKNTYWIYDGLKGGKHIKPTAIVKAAKAGNVVKSSKIMKSSKSSWGSERQQK
mgnify:CR=1 FL=1